MRGSTEISLNAMLRLLLTLCLGCGGDLSSGAGDGGTSDTSTDPTWHCASGELDGDELEVDCGGSCASCALTVLTSDPEAGEDNVELDRVIRVVFSRELDTPLADDAIVVRTSSGERIAGRALADRRTLIFTPTRYSARDVHTVTVDTSLTSGVYALASPHVLTFEAGESSSESSNPPPDGYDPLGPGTQVALGRVPEFALVWTGSADKHFALEDPPYNPTPMLNRATPNAEGMNSVASLRALKRDKLPIVAQLDDDGEEEVAIFSADASGEISLVVVNRSTTAGITSTTASLSFALADFFEADAGDFDRDGRDELLLGISRAGERLRYYLVEYDPASKAYVIAFSGQVASEGATAAEYVRVAAGDIDHDGMAEAIIAWHVVDTTDPQLSNAYYVVHDDAKHELAELFPYRIVQEGIRWLSGCHHSYIDLTTGDVDNDGAAELIFSVYQPKYLGGKWVWFVPHHKCGVRETLLVADNLDPKAPAPPALQLLADELPNGDFWYRKSHVANGALTGRHLPILEAGDLDGAPGDEILLHNLVFKLRASAGGFELAKGWPQTIPNEIVEHGPLKDLTSEGITTDVKIGDVDGDLKQDVVLLRKDGGSVWVDHFDLDAGSGSKVIFSALHTGLQRSGTYDGYAGRPLLALPNVDEDSMIVEAKAHDIYLGENVIIAVLAAAPCSAALGQDLGGCVTEFGQGTTDSRSHGVYVNASAGVTAGFEWEPKVSLPFIDIKLGKVEVEVAVGLEGSYQHSWATETSEQVTYTAGADNNLVVFKAHVYDRYIYRIVAHPDPEKVDTMLTLSVPTGLRTLAVSQDYYNASNGDQLDIDEAVLAIEPGDLASYPRGEVAARELATSAGNRLISISSEAKPTPEGDTNVTGIELGVTHAESNEFSVGAYVNASLKGCGPDASGWNPSVCVGVEGSLSAGYAHAHEWSSDLIFAGSLAGIPRDRFAESSYAAGLFAYEKSISDERSGENQNFIIISYYLQ